ncbi:SdrD B-like domain-containing protein [Leifsonia aquatica]|uniref:SdrD B-like domain-containing protein n=1 Tax=Leifsonia aquatica TaxID=144185 RepID=UPI00384DD542
MHRTVARDPNARTRSTSRPARLVAALVAGLLAVSGLLVATAPAGAAEIPGAISNVTTDKSSYGYSEKLVLSFDWAVPDGSAPGDTFSLTLPPELAAASLARFTLDAPDGTPIATAAWNGRTAVFTLTDYAATHDDVAGTGHFTAQWDHTTVTETGGPVELTFGSTLTTVTIAPKPTPTPCTTNCGPPPVPTSRGAWKGSGWTDGSYEGTRDPSSNISWIVQLPGDQTGYAGPVDVVDTIGAGSAIDCPSLSVTARASLAGGTPSSPVDASRYTVSCTASGLHVVLDAVHPSEFIDLRYTGTITDQRLGTYSNAVTISYPGTTVTKNSTIKRTSAGGSGDGDQSVSVGDLVWLDTNRDGLQSAGEQGIPGVVLVLTGPDGGPVTNVGGAPVGPATTDADGRYLFPGLPVLPAGQHYTVTLDRAASAAALAGLTPTSAGAGADRAIDSSTWLAESGDLTTNRAADLTLDFGFVRPVVTPTEPAEPNTGGTTPGTPATAVPGSGGATPVAAAPVASLAHTGSDVVTPLAAAAALIALGLALAATVSWRRRRAERG